MPNDLAIAQELPAAPPASAREVLANYGVGPGEFSTFVDGREITADEQAVLAKILLRFSRISLENAHWWRKTSADFGQIATVTHQAQGELFALGGRAKRVSEYKLPAEMARQFEFDRYFAVQIDLDGSPRQALVYTRAIPRAWQVGEPIDEPTIADGLLLKLGPPGENGAQPLIFAARRVGWLPESSLLARAGFDVSLFDGVRETNGQGLVAADREPFYQLLSAVDRADAIDPSAANRSLNLVALLEQPEDHHGESFTLRGTVRRVVNVLIGEPDVRQRLRLFHYYEIDLFVPVGEAKLRFDPPPQGKEGPVFENTYPVTLLARRLPPGLTEGENLHAEIAAEAVFFKLWEYESPYMSRYGRGQPAPLVVTSEPRLIPAASDSSGIWGNVLTALLVGLLIAMLVGWWWYERSDRRRARTAAPAGGSSGPLRS